MCTFDPKYTMISAVPQLSEDERIEYLTQEIQRVEEMLDGAEDCKWVYQALINLSVLWERLKHYPYAPTEKTIFWVDKLLELDPLRSGRWQALKETVPAN